MSKSSPLYRFDAAVLAYISSRRALGRAVRVDEYVLHRLRAYLAQAGYCDLDAENFERWRRQLHHCAHNTQVDWAGIFTEEEFFDKRTKIYAAYQRTQND